MPGPSQYVRYLASVVSRIWLLPLYFLSGFARRRRDLWVFGSWGGYRFADNAAAFFEYCNENVGDEVELVWISRRSGIVRRLRERGYRAHWIWSPRGMATCIRAGVALFDCFSKDINFWLLRGAKHVNLWSGVPMKVFERDIDNPRNRYYRLFHGMAVERAVLTAMMPWHVVKPDLIIAMSEETAQITARAFAIPAARVVTTGFPRNDVLLKPLPAALPMTWPAPLRQAVSSGQPVFLYLPTFRDSGRPYLDIDWPHLEQLMAASGAMFVYKFHPMDLSRVEWNSEHVRKLPQDIDLYDILPRTTALISDYSSIIFDYMLLEKPVIYYVPDLENFVTGERALLFEPTDVAIGPVCMGFSDLCRALEAVVSGEPLSGSERRDSVVPRLHAYADSASAERVLAAIDLHVMGGTLGRASMPVAVFEGSPDRA